MLAPVAVVGLGLIGGSIARALVAAGIEVRGWSADVADRDAARAAGVRVVDGDSTERALIAAAADAATIVIAVPIPELPGVAASVLAAAPDDAVLVHVGGLQREDATGLGDEAARRVIGTHPMAGSHESGFAASRADLFAGAVVSAEERASPRERERIEALWHAVGARRVHYRAAADHDELMALVSHLPQLASSALAATLSAQGVAPDVIGTGARDATRLAASSFAVWEGILARGRDDVELALAAYQGTLAAMSRAITSGDVRALRVLWERGRSWRVAAEEQG